MRDDLHHSFPLNHPWRNAVRAASGANIGWDVTAALERAAWSNGADWWSTVWGNDFRRVLSLPPDMFGGERILAELRHLEAACPSVAAKRALDCAYAEVFHARTGPELHSCVIEGALRMCAEDGIENAVARVSVEYDHGQARQLRRRLSDALSHCDFRSPPAPRKAPRKLSVEQGLAMALPYKE